MRTFWGFHQLGPLEQRVLEEVWDRGSTTAREIRSACQLQSYTTINTTLDRLHAKGLLSRVREGNRFRYSATLSRTELDRLVAIQVIRRILENTPSSGPLLSHLVEVVSNHDRKLLDELFVIIEKKRLQTARSA